MSKNKLILLSAIITVALVFLVALIGILSVIVYYNETLRPNLSAFSQAAVFPMISFFIILAVGMLTIFPIVNEYESLDENDTTKEMLHRKMYSLRD